jgi:hypothetical protein
MRCCAIASALLLSACTGASPSTAVDGGFLPPGHIGGDLGQSSDLAMAPPPDGSSPPATDGGAWTRDFTAHPAVYRQSGATRLWALSDVHGDRDRLVALLSAAGLVGGTASAPTWTGGTDTLVVNGDNIDKGSQSVEVLDYWMALTPSVDAASGHLAVLLGNHEAEFLDDPTNSKAATLDSELVSLTPQAFADPMDPHGRFLHERPIAALVDGWFFSHAGNSQGLSLDQIAAKYTTVVQNGAWGDPFLLDPSSIIEGRTWWPSKGTSAFLDGYLAALPAKHIVFGHSPPTFQSPPSGDIEAHFAGRLLLIDVGMSSAVNDSTGKLLRVDQPGTPAEQASMVDPTGSPTPIDLTAP